MFIHLIYLYLKGKHKQIFYVTYRQIVNDNHKTHKIKLGLEKTKLKLSINL